MATALAHYFPQLQIDPIDVDSTAAWQQRYGALVPVLAAGDDVICHYELDRVALEQYLARIGDGGGA